MELRVWKWHHSWEDDNTILLYPSEAAARAAIHNYVEGQWQDGLMDHEEFTGDVDTDIQKYFECYDDSEWYNLSSQIVDFPAMAAFENNEVILDSNECAIVCAALSTASRFELGDLLGINTDKVAEHTNSAYEKLKD